MLNKVVTIVFLYIDNSKPTKKFLKGLPSAAPMRKTQNKKNMTIQTVTLQPVRNDNVLTLMIQGAYMLLYKILKISQEVSQNVAIKVVYHSNLSKLIDNTADVWDVELSEIASEYKCALSEVSTNLYNALIHKNASNSQVVNMLFLSTLNDEHGNAETDKLFKVIIEKNIWSLQWLYWQQSQIRSEMFACN